MKPQEPLRRCGGRRRAGDPLGVLSGHPEVHGELVDLVVGLAARLALVFGERPGQFLPPDRDPGRDPLAGGGPLERRGGSPLIERFGGSHDGGVHVGLVTDRDGSELLAGRRAHGSGVAATAGSPTTADVQAMIPHGSDPPIKGRTGCTSPITAFPVEA